MSPIIIVCDFNLGTQTQLVYKCDEINQTVEPIIEVGFADLPAALFNSYVENNAKVIHLYGADEILNGLAQEIQGLKTGQYADLNINIEIN